MIVHVFLFKWKDGTPKEDIDRIFYDIERLRTSPGLIGMRYGEDFSGKSKDHTDALVTSFKDKESLKNFLESPLHKDLMRRVEHLKDSYIGADFESKA